MTLKVEEILKRYPDKNKKSADSADKVQTHLSALFNKVIGPYNIDIIIYIYIYIYKYNKIRQCRHFSMHRGKKNKVDINSHV